jgi:hypothetical protein
MPAILILPGVFYQTMTRRGQQFVAVNAIDNSYLFHAVASFLIVNKKKSEKDIKKHLANDIDARKEANIGH